MADIPFPTNLLPQYQSPQQMALSAAQTQNLQANAGLTNVQAQGADIANQGAQLKLGLLQNFLQGQGGGDSAAPSGQTAPAPIGSTAATADDITGHAFSQFAPIPAAPPPGLLQKSAQAALAGMPEYGAALKAQWEASVTGENQRRQLAANAAYQTADQVANAPAGAAWETLSRYNPDAAKALKQQDANDTPEKLDADVRAYSQHIAHATYQYSGRESEFQNGVQVDKKSGAPVTGSAQVLTGLDAAGKQKAFEEANTPVTVGDQLPVPRWQASGYASPGAYVIAADRAARSSAASPSTASAPSGTPSMIQSTPAPAPKAAPAPSAADPQLRTALADTSFRYQPPPTPKNQSDLAANTDQAKANVAARQTLKADSDDATKAAAQAQTYLQAAKAIMDSKGANVGAYGALIAKASALMPGESVDATNYQEVAKYLGNAALANARGIYGNRMTQSEVGLQLNELSPSVHMTDTAINNLLNTNLKASQYTIDSAKRVLPYLSAGNDPSNFSKWNQNYWNQGTTVNGPQATPTRPGQQASGAPVRVSSHADYAKVPKGAQYVDPNGVTRTKGGS